MKILIMMIIIIVAVVRFHQETFKVTKYPQLKDLPWLKMIKMAIFSSIY